MTKAFSRADSNNDDHLDEDEFKNFFIYMIENMQSRGTPTMPFDDQNWDAMYAFFSHASPKGGITRQNIITALDMIR